jgi:hypothetical protein
MHETLGLITSTAKTTTKKRIKERRVEGREGERETGIEIYYFSLMVCILSRVWKYCY